MYIAKLNYNKENYEKIHELLDFSGIVIILVQFVNTRFTVQYYIGDFRARDQFDTNSSQVTKFSDLGTVG